MIEKNLKIILAVIIVGIIILSSAFIGLKFQFDENINDDKENIESLYIKILADSSSGTSPLTVNFNPLVLDEVGNLEYLWEFGDGNSSTEKSPVYLYEKEGEYFCKLTVRDQNTEKTDNFNITVYQNNPPDVKIILSKNTAFRPETITFDSQVFDREGDELEYEWKLRYPSFLGYEKVETITEKNFTKKFWRPGNYVAELTVTDSAGNSVYQFARLSMGKSEPEQFYQQIKGAIVFLPTTVGIIWTALKLIEADGKITQWLDDHWLEWPENIQNIARAILIDFLKLDYEPPIPSADLMISNVTDIDHSPNVNSSGAVTAEASKSSSILIENEDEITAKNMYLTLVDPLTGETGINEAIELDALEVSIDIGSISKKLFYKSEYTNFEDSYFIENLATGDKFNGDITVSLNIADPGTFTKGTYACNIYLYQETADFVDVIPFNIVI